MISPTTYPARFALAIEIFGASLTALRAELTSARSGLLAVTLDLSAPNLVDLLDEISHGPHGERVVALAARVSSSDLVELPIRRGIGTLIDRDLALVLLADSVGPDELQQLWPRLHVLEPNSTNSEIKASP